MHEGGGSCQDERVCTPREGGRAARGAHRARVGRRRLAAVEDGRARRVVAEAHPAADGRVVSPHERGVRHQRGGATCEGGGRGAHRSRLTLGSTACGRGGGMRSQPRRTKSRLSSAGRFRSASQSCSTRSASCAGSTRAGRRARREERRGARLTGRGAYRGGRCQGRARLVEGRRALSAGVWRSQCHLLVRMN